MVTDKRKLSTKNIYLSLVKNYLAIIKIKLKTVGDPLYVFDAEKPTIIYNHFKIFNKRNKTNSKIGAIFSDTNSF